MSIHMWINKEPAAKMIATPELHSPPSQMINTNICMLSSRRSIFNFGELNFDTIEEEWADI